ncbi:hypothetical protein [Pseudoalteromonas sp. H105]|uniref:hypothetical protein n=1 Tax=Pseudoalteromonas sp. H105 TaxID=1348393 RepID=UPI000731F11F|nr:hypothetical protein [Pseudoalteromonas sp. H105]KTF13699.1 hypothetical protein ATS75_14095 [Pseudoalteromonas sp. H105]
MLLTTESIGSIRKKISGSPRLACFIYSYWLWVSGDSIKQSFEDHLRAINELNDDCVTEAFENWNRYKLEGTVYDDLKGYTRLINFVQSYLYNIKFKEGLQIVLSEDKYVQVRALLDIAHMEYTSQIFVFSDQITRAVNDFEKIKSRTSWIHFEDEQSVDWVMDYISKHQRKSRGLFNNSHNYPEDKFPDKPSCKVNTLDRKKNFIEYFFDTLPYLTNPDHAENFIIKIKRANSQRKYRNDNAERTSSNYMLKNDIKIKLKTIADKERLPLNKTIELLIEQAHSRLK